MNVDVRPFGWKLAFKTRGAIIVLPRDAHWRYALAVGKAPLAKVILFIVFGFSLETGKKTGEQYKNRFSN